MNCKIKYINGSIKYTNVCETKYDEYLNLTLSDKLDFSKIEYIDFDTERSMTKVNDNGYFCIIQGTSVADNALCFFSERDEIEYVSKSITMPIVCVKNENTCYIGIVTGMPMNTSQVVTLKDGIYRNYIRFNINGEEPYEDIEMRIYALDGNAGYSEMARTYRNYQISHNGFKAIKDRLTPELDYAAKSLYVRIRQAWKPVPCAILEQTEENEPPVYAACTFKQVAEIMRAYKERGVEKAEFCLVGWNKSGHDGRWPQILPVEESLGGENDLKEMIEYAESIGYIVSCHTNCTDAYSIAENFDINDIARTNKGDSVIGMCSIQEERWGGGRTYNICPQKALKNVRETYGDIRKLGFRGLHYIDVITATPPRNCYHPEHPVNYREGSKLLSDALDYSRKLFGGSGSESAYDYSLAGCDYSLYVSFGRRGNVLTDKFIPLWQLVYNGIVISSPYSETVNAIVSPNPDQLLRTIEYNGRPALYYYSQFVSDGTNWIGDSDFTYEKNNECADAAKKQYDIFAPLAYLQTEFMEHHEEIEPNVFEIKYSDGSIVTVDYNNKTYNLVKGNKK